MITTPGTDGLRVILDSDALIAMAEESDALHERSAQLFDVLTTRQASLFIASTTAAEVITTLQRKYSNRSAARDLYERLLTQWITILPVDRDLIVAAHEYYTRSRSKQNTIFDAMNIAVVKKHHLDAIFSFDRWYARHGVRLVEDMIRTDR